MKLRDEGFVLPLIVAAALILIWEFTVRLLGSTIFPRPVAVLTGMVELARRGVLLKYVLASVVRRYLRRSSSQQPCRKSSRERAWRSALPGWWWWLPK